MLKKDTVCIVDDDEGMRNAIARLLRTLGVEVQTYALPSEFLQDPEREECRCLLLDMRMPEMSGLKLQTALLEQNWTTPIVFMTGYADVPMVVEAMRQGAINFLQKPFSDQQLLDCVQEALKRSQEMQQDVALHAQLEARLALLTPREQEVMTMLIDGLISKVIADRLGISARTVEDHRSSILKKLRVPSVVVLIGVLSKIKRP